MNRHSARRVTFATRIFSMVLISLSMSLAAKAWQAAPRRPDFQHALIPDMIADPTIVEIDGTFYCYATTDGYGGTPLGYGPGVVWSSPDFVNWSFHGLLMPDDSKDKYVAPSSPVRTTAGIYLFPTSTTK